MKMVNGHEELISKRGYRARLDKSHGNINAYEGVEKLEIEGGYLVVNGVLGYLVFQTEIKAGTQWTQGDKVMEGDEGNWKG